MAFDVHSYVLDVVKGVRAKVVDGIAMAEENKADAERTIASCNEQLAALDAWIATYAMHETLIAEGHTYVLKTDKASWDLWQFGRKSEDGTPDAGQEASPSS